jgi:hypothetical protein
VLKSLRYTSAQKDGTHSINDIKPKRIDQSLPPLLVNIREPLRSRRPPLGCSAIRTEIGIGKSSVDLPAYEWRFDGDGIRG